MKKLTAATLTGALLLLSQATFAAVINFYYNNEPSWPTGADVNTPAIYSYDSQLLNTFPSEDYQSSSHYFQVSDRSTDLTDYRTIFVSYGHQGDYHAICYPNKYVQIPANAKIVTFALTWDQQNNLSCVPTQIIT